MNFAAWSRLPQKWLVARQIAGRLRQQKAATTVSHETIYRFIYAQIRRTQDCLAAHLPRQFNGLPRPQGCAPLIHKRPYP